MKLIHANIRENFFSLLENLDLSKAKEKIDSRISYIRDKSDKGDFGKEIEELLKIRNYITNDNNSDFDKILAYFFGFELFSANDLNTSKSDRSKISKFINLDFNNENKE